MGRLWAAFASLYGYSFTRQFGSEPDRTWTNALADLTDEQMLTGLDALQNRAGEFPPGAIEFKQLCKQLRSPDGINALAYRPFQIEHKEPIDPEYGRKQLNKLRSEVGI